MRPWILVTSIGLVNLFSQFISNRSICSHQMRAFNLFISDPITQSIQGRDRTPDNEIVGGESNHVNWRSLVAHRSVRFISTRLCGSNCEWISWSMPFHSRTDNSNHCKGESDTATTSHPLSWQLIERQLDWSSIEHVGGIRSSCLNITENFGTLINKAITTVIMATVWWDLLAWSWLSYKWVLNADRSPSLGQTGDCQNWIAKSVTIWHWIWTRLIDFPIIEDRWANDFQHPTQSVLLALVEHFIEETEHQVYIWRFGLIFLLDQASTFNSSTNVPPRTGRPWQLSQRSSHNPLKKRSRNWCIVGFLIRRDLNIKKWFHQSPKRSHTVTAVDTVRFGDWSWTWNHVDSTESFFAQRAIQYLWSDTACAPGIQWKIDTVWPDMRRWVISYVIGEWRLGTIQPTIWFGEVEMVSSVMPNYHNIRGVSGTPRLTKWSFSRRWFLFVFLAPHGQFLARWHSRCTAHKNHTQYQFWVLLASVHK
jgi:hypothetical protein